MVTDDTPRKTAWVSCWINTDDEQDARQRAETMIGENGWSVIELDQCYPIAREGYPTGSDGLPYFEQALIDDEVLVFYVVAEK